MTPLLKRSNVTLTKSLAVAKRPRDCCMGQFWPNVTGKWYCLRIS